MGTNLPLTRFPILGLPLCTVQKARGPLGTDSSLLGEATSVLSINPYLSTPAGNRCLPSC